MADSHHNYAVFCLRRPIYIVLMNSLQGEDISTLLRLSRGRIAKLFAISSSLSLSLSLVHCLTISTQQGRERITNEIHQVGKESQFSIVRHF